MNISKRDVKFFVFGIVFLLVLEIVINWSQSVNSFKQGFYDGYNSAKTEKSK